MSIHKTLALCTSIITANTGLLSLPATYSSYEIERQTNYIYSQLSNEEVESFDLVLQELGCTDAQEVVEKVLRTNTPPVSSSEIIDINNDNACNVSDVQCILSFCTGSYQYDGDFKDLDVNGDLVIDQNDAMLYLEFYVYVITYSYSFTPGTPGSGSAPLTAYENRSYQKCVFSNGTPNPAIPYSLNWSTRSANMTSLARNTVLPYPDNREGDDNPAVVKISRNSGSGSGAIIGNHLVLTCAHNIYSRENNCFMSDGYVNVYTDNYSVPDLTCQIVEAHVPVSYINGNSEPLRSSYDYALVYVTENLSEYGKFNLGVATDDFLNVNATDAESVFASGFPGYVYGQPANGVRYLSEGIMGPFDVTASINNYPSSCEKRFHATCVISPGDSGGPVYMNTTYDNTDYNILLGITTGGRYNIQTQTGDGTYGVRVTPNLLFFYFSNSYIHTS